MKVYNVDVDVNTYQSLYFKDSKRVEAAAQRTDPLLAFDCQPVADIWVASELYVLRPRLKKPNVYGLQIPGALIFDDEAVDALQTFLDMAGELLPVNTDTGVMHLLNVTECLNCLDSERSEWVIGKTGGNRLWPRKYIFHPDRFSESSLFKIPERCQSDLMTWEETGDPEVEFKAAVEHHGLKGFKFELIWNSET